MLKIGFVAQTRPADLALSHCTASARLPIIGGVLGGFWSVGGYFYHYSRGSRKTPLWALIASQSLMSSVRAAAGPILCHVHRLLMA